MMKTKRKSGKVPSVLSEESVKPKAQKSQGKQKSPTAVKSLFSGRRY